ncbi:hypothetical protein H4R33_003225 [Dimargaris cristalligena]|uniref:Ser-Thr-rich glycosyl-phosphatidyl-inositol-anchored membrane family-domain-containing protein n=1 Tax=Dimargaris cristalligena TaxID=215637 RepID=A0A4Q0A1Z7_9FUNG|nr:hypothetical protein H4R33_003225 [Dimargaris cristalligena]RKP39190.1 hypothetical protein BJ085DRAFT_33920 [Dimargaris cristalligena]|eukprot:RKP39190.1 hypothetical protein BJ085DRAFT_33920 [Dimargaris cristalligena]
MVTLRCIAFGLLALAGTTLAELRISHPVGDDAWTMGKTPAISWYDDGIPPVTTQPEIVFYLHSGDAANLRNLGQLEFRQVGPNQVEINPESLPGPGVYSVSINYDGKRAYSRFFSIFADPNETLVPSQTPSQSQSQSSTVPTTTQASSLASMASSTDSASHSTATKTASATSMVSAVSTKSAAPSSSSSNMSLATRSTTKHPRSTQIADDEDDDGAASGAAAVSLVALSALSLSLLYFC